MPTTPQNVGAHSLTGKRKHGLRWLPWVALLMLLAAVLIVANVNDENDDSRPRCHRRRGHQCSAPALDSPAVVAT